MKKLLSGLCLKFSSAFAGWAFRLSGESPLTTAAPLDQSGLEDDTDDSNGDILPSVSLSPEAAAMRVDMRKPRPNGSPKPKPLAGSIEERLAKTGNRW